MPQEKVKDQSLSDLYEETIPEGLDLESLQTAIAGIEATIERLEAKKSVFEEQAQVFSRINRKNERVDERKEMRAAALANKDKRRASKNPTVEEALILGLDVPDSIELAKRSKAGFAFQRMEAVGDLKVKRLGITFDNELDEVTEFLEDRKIPKEVIETDAHRIHTRSGRKTMVTWPIAKMLWDQGFHLSRHTHPTTYNGERPGKCRAHAIGSIIVKLRTRRVKAKAEATT